MTSLGNLLFARVGRDKRRMNAVVLRALWVVGVAGTCIIAEEPRAAERPSPQNNSDSTTYRRLFVPADDADAWPVDGQKFIPIDARELDKLIDTANGNGSASASRATIVEAIYTGRMTSDGVVAGSGTWRIGLHGNSSSILPLGNIPFTIRDPYWSDDPMRPARLGYWGRSGGQPETLGLEVARAGLLKFSWQVNLNSRGADAASTWKLPPAASSRVILDLPSTHRPVVEGGIILEDNAQIGNAIAGTRLGRWEMLLSGSRDAQLRLTAASTEREETVPDIRLSEEVAYRLDARGVRIVAIWRCDGAVSQLRELVVPLPDGVQFISAEAEGEELAWQMSTHPTDAVSEVVIEAPKSLAGNQIAVTVRAWQPLPTAGPRRLPSPRPKGMQWISGTIELSVSPQLELQRLSPVDCIQTGVVQSQGDGTGSETHWFTAYSPAAGLEISTGRFDPRVSARINSLLSVSDTQINGSLVVQLDVARGSVHKLTGHLANGWIVESVESIPDDAVGEWIVTRGDGRAEIEVQLAKAPNPQRVVTVRVDGRLEPASYAEPIPLETLRMVRWHGVEVAEHLLSFQAVEPYAAEPRGNLPTATSQQLMVMSNTPADAADAAVFDLTHAPEGSALGIVLERGEFEADISLDATIVGREAQLAYRLIARPVKSRIDRLLIFANSPLSDDIRWVDAESGAALSAERLETTDALRTGFPADGQLWLVRLRQPTSRAVEIVVAHALKLAARQPVPLLCLPRAVEQQGRIHVSGDAVRLPILEQSGLQPVPVPVSDDDEQRDSHVPSIIGAYRYNPVDCSDSERSPRIWLTPTSSSETDGLVARQAQIESYFAADGRVGHKAIYQLMAGDSVELLLPEAAKQVTASLDLKPLPSSQIDQGPEKPSLRVPEQPGTAVLTIQFETRQAPPSVGVELRPPVIDNLAVLSGEWTIWLPAELKATSDNPWQTDEKQNWRRRLFGPLGRAATSSPFNPLRIATGDILAPVVVEPIGANSASGSSFTASLTPGFLASNGTDRTLDGWRAYRAAFVSQGPKPFVVVSTPKRTAWAVTLFLLCFVVGGRVANWNRELFVALAATMAGLALILPASFAPLATGAFLGLLFSLIAGRRPVLENEDSPTKTWTRVSATGAMAMAITLFLTETAPAQPPQGALHSHSVASPQSTEPTADVDTGVFPSSTSTIHRVLVPVDASGQAVGGKHYVDETFLRKLYELANDDRSPDWLMMDVACEGELVEDAESEIIVAGRWNLSLDIEVLARGTAIKLPLRREEAAWQTEASLDGLPVPIQWSPDAQNCTVRVAEPGRYTLSFPFAPTIERANNQNRIDLTIPALPGGKFHLHHPADISGWEVNGVATSSQTAVPPESLNGELDGSGRLTTRWLRRPETGRENAGLRVTELQWLHAGKDRVELYVKFIIEGGVRRPEALSVAIDGPWKLLASQNVISDEPMEGGGGRVVQVALPPDDIDRQEVLLRLDPIEPRTLGVIILPRIGLELVPVAQRWIALSSDSELACEFVGADKAVVGSADEFQTRWGEARDTNDLIAVISESTADSSTKVAVRPRPAQPSINETLQIAAGSESLRLQLAAEVDPGGTTQFQSSLFVSDEVQIDTVTLTRAGQELPVRWSRNGNDVCVFFGEGISQSYLLNVQGHVFNNGSGIYKMPRIASDAKAAGQSVRFYREDNVLLEMRGFAQNAQPDSTNTELPIANSNHRLAGAFLLAPSSFTTGQLVVTPNTIRSAGQTLTAIDHDSDGWWATFICRFAVEQGELRGLQLRAPTTWLETRELESEIPAVMEQTGDDSQPRLITIRFSDPIEAGKEVTFRLRGRLTPESTSQIAVPDISIDTQFRGQHYVVVPSSVDSRSATWTEQGVQQAPLPRELQELHPQAAIGNSWEVTSRPFRMLLQTLSGDVAPATVRLADTLAAIGPFGGQLFVTRMVVVSRGPAECQLELPSNQQLVRVSLEGRPAFSRQLDDRHWLVPLGATNLPHVLEIVTRSSLMAPRNGAGVEWFRPTLLLDGKPIPAEVSLWSVGFPSAPAELSITGAAVVSAAEQAGLRLDRLTSIVESATRNAIDLPLSDGKSWYLPWARRLNAFRRTSVETIGQAGGNGDTVLQVQSATEQQLADAAQRVETWLEQGDQIWSVPEQAPSISEQSENAVLSNWELAASAANEWTYCVADGDASRLLIDGLPTSDQQSHSQLVGLLAIFASAAGFLAIVRWQTGREFACRWPHGIAFLAGIAWWAFLWPSVVGLLIAAASVWLALRPGWPGRSMRLEGSTVIRTEQGARSRE